MPTIDISDKICSHCGGIKWKIEKEKRKYGIRTRYRCAKRVAERIRKWRSKNPEKISNYGKSENRKKYKKLYCQSESYKSKQRQRFHDGKKNLTDRYVKHLICHENELSQSDVPQELIKLKRKQLLLIRQNKKNGKK